MRRRTKAKEEIKIKEEEEVEIREGAFEDL